MSKTLKKILVTGASLLMFASVGAGLNNVNHTANASSGYYYVKHNYNPGGDVPGLRKGTRLYGKPQSDTDIGSHSVDFPSIFESHGFIPWRIVGYHHYHRYSKRHYRKHFRRHAHKHHLKTKKRARRHLRHTRKHRTRYRK